MPLRILALALIAVLVSPAAFGQPGAGAIHITVRDPSGAEVSGAWLMLKGPSTGAEVKQAVTGAERRYTFSNLPPGTYSLTVVAPGFNASVNEKIVVEAGPTNGRQYEAAAHRGPLSLIPVGLSDREGFVKGARILRGLRTLDKSLPIWNIE